MARSELRPGPSAARRRGADERKPFFSPAVRKAVADRGYALSGFAFGCVALVMIAALVSHDPADPSLNASVPEGVEGVSNVLGLPGAWFSDLALQGVGWAAYLLPAMVMVWGWLFSLRRPPRRVASGIVLLILGILAAAAALGGASADPLAVQPGGAFGILVRRVPIPAGVDLGGETAVTRILGVLSAFLLFLSTGVSLREWGGVLLTTVFAVVRFPFRVARRLPSGSRAVREDVGAPRAAPRVSAGGSAATGRDPMFSRREPPPPRVVEPSGATVAETRVVRPAPEPPPAVATGLVSTDEPSFEFPPLELLRAPDPGSRADRPSDADLARSAAALVRVLDDFGVKGEIRKVNPGPVVTLYELEPAPGTKSSRVIGLADDIARSMSAVSARVAVVPGRNVIGIELPNTKREIVLLRELFASDAFIQHQGKLALALGKDIGGQPIVADLSRFPHLLVAGTTGSGKSVAINTMILSLLRKLPPDRCRFIMIDPKMLELSVYEGIPHLLAPVVTDPKKAVVALKWTVREMEERYRSMSKLGVRNIDGFNARLKEARENGESLTRRVQTGFDPDTGKPLYEEQPLDLNDLPHIVVVVDEMADLMLVAGKDIEAAVQRLAQMARAAGIHIIMATQRPSVDVITGTIKANFPTRISFQVTSRIDSRTILGEHGAEQLLGQGDMLYMAGGGRISRVHGPFVSDGEVEEIVKFLKARGEPAYVDAVTEDDDEPSGGDGDVSSGGGERKSGDDELYDRAVAIVCRERKASTSFVQRQMRIGYNSAARLIERMEAEGVVSKPNHSGKREVLARDIDEPA